MKWQRESRERRSQQREEAGQGPDKRQQAWGNAKTSLSTANLKCSYFPKDNTEFFLILVVFFFFLVAITFIQWNTDPILGLGIVAFLWPNYFFFNFISRL